MYSIVEGMFKMAIELGVEFYFDHDVKRININSGKAKTVSVLHNGDIEEKLFDADVVVAAADYHFVEKQLLPPEYRSYTKEYWNKRTMAPSCLIYYIGINKKLKNILHHSLFFDSDFDLHGKEIYTDPKWPSEPLFYVSATSVTDRDLAPENCENLFFLIPVASGLTGDDEKLREDYLDRVLTRFETLTGESVKDAIIYKRSYSVADFVSDYNAFKGNAYGLANTLMQTAILKPSIKSKKVSNLFFTGQLTVPGPGVPPSLISGEVVAKEIIKQFNHKNVIA
jgi:phytoene desaturase